MDVFNLARQGQSPEAAAVANGSIQVQKRTKKEKAEIRPTKTSLARMRHIQGSLETRRNSEPRSELRGSCTIDDRDRERTRAEERYTLIIADLEREIADTKDQLAMLQSHCTSLHDELPTRLLQEEQRVQQGEVANELLLLRAVQAQIDYSQDEIQRLSLRRCSLRHDVDELERRNEEANVEMERVNYLVFKKGQMASCLELEDEGLEEDNQFKEEELTATFTDLVDTERRIQSHEPAKATPHLHRGPHRPSPFLLSHLRAAVKYFVKTLDQPIANHGAVARLSSLFEFDADEMSSIRDPQ